MYTYSNDQQGGVYNGNPGNTVWAWSQPEAACVEQALTLSRMPYVHGSVVLMPDAHMGMGMPIGGVFCSRFSVVPNAVGVDIGCGMAVVALNLKDEPNITPSVLESLMETLYSVIPVGFAHHRTPVVEMPPPTSDRLAALATAANAACSLGTLGGNNHFLELQRDTEGRLYLMVHSGSRKLGLEVAKHHNAIAESLCAAYYHDAINEAKLAFLPRNGAGAAYLADMAYCVDYARLNRATMLDRALAVVNDYWPLEAGERYDVHHNYAAIEHHHGTATLVHRKGAICARAGQRGIIPGSMGTPSYLVDGLGNHAAYDSAPHGAGRTMSRTAARAAISVELAEEDTRGVTHRPFTVDHVDEAPTAYKDIATVMAESADLVRITTTLRPLLNLKGLQDRKRGTR